ncbi:MULTISPECIES: MFS transporter [unclassified Rathayibacter]|uniref:MFS transporter n=1 Tax=unclassified Rathayibacter TaxID=2609250 RepID=UPI000FA30087|nr:MULTISPECIES: MFS transporter [unclassified Rathayibacter]ROP43450.1 putative MFS transporter [Rathayibacter sp. PhB186]ROS46606.1 putative MFS transporter [Rathayibacter sp. PhB185]
MSTVTNPPPATTMGDRIEAAYSRIGVTSAHLGIVAMILFGVFFDAIEQNTVGVAGPILAADWGLAGAQIGLLNTATFTAVALGRVLAGVVMDRIGRRTLLGANLMIFAVGSLLCAFAPSYEILVAARFLVGLGLGGEIATAVIMLAEFFSAKHRGTAVGLINVAAAGLGNMLAPLFGVIVFSVFTGDDRWRWLFGILVIPALAVVVYRRALPETPRYLAARGRVAEANTVINRLAQGRLHRPVTDEVDYLGGVADRPVTAVSTPRWTELFGRRHRRTTIALGVAVCMSYAAQISMLTLIPLILTSRGFDITSALWYTLVMQSGSLVGALVAALAARRLPRKLTLTVAALLGIGAGLGFGFLGTTVALVLVFGFLFNFSVIVLNTTIWLFAPEQYPTRIRGLGTSVILALGSLSGGLFPLLAGAVLDASGVGGMFALLAGLFAICAIAVQFPRETVGRPMAED